MKQVLRIHGRGDLPVELAGALGSASEQAVQCARSAMAAHASRRRDPVVNGALMLPHTTAHEDFFEQSREGVIRRGGTGFVLRASGSSPESNESIVRLFQSDRSREYGEFAERCAAFLDEISRETAAEKHTFAEMEESEQDPKKLVRWLAKIRRVLRGFSRAVYKVEGVQESAAGWDYPITLEPETTTVKHSA